MRPMAVLPCPWRDDTSFERETQTSRSTARRANCVPIGGGLIPTYFLLTPSLTRIALTHASSITGIGVGQTCSTIASCCISRCLPRQSVASMNLSVGLSPSPSAITSRLTV